eukprot:jgi/Phyca11/21188/fgenesh1_pg.PHYCAscaffold_85_\
MEHKNFTNSVKRRYNGTMYYICSHFRPASCPARLIVKSSGAIEEVGEHACGRESETVIEATEEMREVHEALATTDISVAPSAVWKAANRHLHRKHGENASLRYLPRHRAVPFVKNVRKELTGGNVFRAIELDKYQDTYWHLLDNVIMQCNLQVEPRYVTCDFELGLVNAVRQVSPL